MKTNIVKIALVALILVPAGAFAARNECSKVGTKDIKGGSITSREIADGSIETADLADSAVDGQHIPELVTIKPFTLAAGEKRDLLDTGDLRVEANCFGSDGYDTATVNIWNVTDGAMLYGAEAATTGSGSSAVANPGSDDKPNLTSAVPAGNRELHRAAATTGNVGLDYATRSHVLGANGDFIRSQLYVGVNLRGVLGCHFGGMIYYTPAS